MKSAGSVRQLKRVYTLSGNECNTSLKISTPPGVSSTSAIGDEGLMTPEKAVNIPTDAIYNDREGNDLSRQNSFFSTPSETKASKRQNLRKMKSIRHAESLLTLEYKSKKKLSKSSKKSLESFRVKDGEKGGMNIFFNFQFSVTPVLFRHILHKLYRIYIYTIDHKTSAL
jgi:hypothetical protein